MKIAIAAIAALAAVGSAHATTITSLYNTGVDDSHVALPGTGPDTHYTIVANDGAQAAGTQAVAANCCYSADDATSRWVTIDGTGQDAANTDYQTTFSLAGLAPATVSISGNFAADNHAEIFLNGTDTGFHTDTFAAYTPFTLTSGFVSGLNTLDFKVANDGGPEALRVADLSGSGSAPTGGVPEPTSWVLMLLGVGAMGGVLRRERLNAFAAL